MEFLSNKDCKEDYYYFAKSNEFDMYIAFNEQGEPYIHDHDFGLINHMKKMLRVLQSENFIKMTIKTTTKKICGNVFVV